MKVIDRLLTSKYEEQMEHDKWIKDIPYINFPNEWKVQITPPFCGAVVRFRVKCGDADISVYLDCYDTIGCYGEPYWEIYPCDDDVYRCGIQNINELLEKIQYSIDILNPTNKITP